MSYQKILKDIKLLIESYNISWDANNIKFIYDIEKSLIKAIKTEFNKSKINGCFFHYFKALWKKAKTLGIAKLRLLRTTKLIIFGFKINPFIFKYKKNI